MPHHTEASWASTISKQKDMYEAVRTDALGLGPVAEVHPPDLRQQRSPYHTQHDIRDAEMNETGRDTEELEELQVGASLILAEGDAMPNDEQEPSLEGGNKDTDKRDAYARDFEALVGFLTSADADCGREDEIFDRLTAKVILTRIFTDKTSNGSSTEHMPDCSELVRLFGAACGGRNRRS
jgi:hypothetical protein